MYVGLEELGGIIKRLPLRLEAAVLIIPNGLRPLADFCSIQQLESNKFLF